MAVTTQTTRPAGGRFRWLAGLGPWLKQQWRTLRAQSAALWRIVRIRETGRGVEPGAGLLSPLFPAERRLLLGQCGRDEIKAVFRSRTRVDVGRWLRGGRVWAAVTADRLILIAHGPQPVAESAPFAALDRSLYNHVTGELLLSPAEPLSHRRLKMPPMPARLLLDRFVTEES